MLSDVEMNNLSPVMANNKEAVLLFEKEPVAKNDSSVKCQAGFGAVPSYEFDDGMAV